MVVVLVELVTQVVVTLHKMVDLVDQVVVVLKAMEMQDRMVEEDKEILVEQDQELPDLLRTLAEAAAVAVVPAVMHQEMLLEELVVLVFNFPQYSRSNSTVGAPDPEVVNIGSLVVVEEEQQLLMEIVE